MKIETTQSTPVVRPVTITLETPEEIGAMLALTGCLNGDAGTLTGLSHLYGRLASHVDSALSAADQIVPAFSADKLKKLNVGFEWRCDGRTVGFWRTAKN